MRRQADQAQVGMIGTLRIARRSALKMRTQAVNQMRAVVVTAPEARPVPGRSAGDPHHAGRGASSTPDPPEMMWSSRSGKTGSLGGAFHTANDARASAR